ncbi:MAG: DUF4097 family beta strand repeat protein [Chitinophagaceae bacterium]|jgi:hypothetical protein|nr:DUF4097 family beta strand repeat protein [Chitinophagaceae bacterium]
MKKKIISLLAIVCVLATTGFAQEYKLAKSTGKLVINLSAVTVEGYNGNEIVFSSLKSKGDDDERAKGLRPINASGNTDNTGLGISVEEKGGVIEVNPVGKVDDVKIMVPKGVSVSYKYSKLLTGRSTSVFKNLESELEVSVSYNKIKLENVTGPVTAKTIYGAIDAEFGQNIKGPLSLVSVYGHVDVAIPTTTKANLKLNSSWGEILASSELKIEVEKAAGDMISYRENNVKGKLNGGGFDLNLTSNYGKVYLRKTN